MADDLIDRVHLERPSTDDLVSPRGTGWRTGRRIFFLLAAARRMTVTVHHRERFPAGTAVILASNHTGILDGPVLWATTPRPTHAMTKIEMFTGLNGRMLRTMGQIPIDRDEVDPLAVRTSLRVLRDGGCVVVFPEGGRGVGEVVTTKGGAAYLALVTGAPVLPVACLGTREDGADISTPPPRGSHIDVVYGQPMAWPAEPWPRTKDRVDDVRRVIQDRLHRLVADSCAATGRTLPAMGPEQ